MNNAPVSANYTHGTMKSWFYWAYNPDSGGYLPSYALRQMALPVRLPQQPAALCLDHTHASCDDAALLMTREGPAATDDDLHIVQALEASSTNRTGAT